MDYENFVKLPALPREERTEYVYRVLYHNIMHLNLIPGQVIREVDIADLLQVSRTPVREAFLRLREDHLLDIYTKNRTEVSYIDEDLIEEGLYIRTSLEGRVFEKLSENLSEEYRKKLEENLKIQRLLSQDPDLYRQFFDYDNEFHELLFFAANMEWSYTIQLRACVHLDRVRYIRVLADSGKHTSTSLLYNDHLQLFEMMLAHEIEDGLSLLDKHLHRQFPGGWQAEGSIYNKYLKQTIPA